MWLGQGSYVWFKGPQNECGVQLGMALFIPDYKGWSIPRVGGSEEDTTAQMLSRSAPLNRSSTEWQRRSKQWCYMERVSLGLGTGWEQVSVLRDSSGYAEHKLQGGFCQQTVSVERLLFPGHNRLQVREWVSKEMLWFLSWLFAHLGLHWAEFRDLIYIRVTVRNIWKLWFLKPSEVWQFHLVGNVHTDIGKFFISFIRTQRE